jgi:23S rRNA (pseudouridine1915-N3)-methyltransferase
MRIVILAVGRMKAGPERQIAERFFDRIAKSGRAEGFEFGGVLELTESRAQQAEARKSDEAARIAGKMPSDATLILLDERGENLDSGEFAKLLGTHRDKGTNTLAFAIGGPDGHGDEMRNKASATISFGALTWPHQLARVMLAEQIYRAVTILSGHPYHRS